MELVPKGTARRPYQQHRLKLWHGCSAMRREPAICPHSRRQSSQNGRLQRSGCRVDRRHI